MDTRSIFFVVALTLFVSFLAATALHYRSQIRRSSRSDLEGLLAQLLLVDREHVALIALDWRAVSSLTAEDDVYPGLEPADVLDLLGGLKGLDALAANTEVLIRLVSRLQSEYPEALVVAERLRLHAREVQWYIGRLRAASGQSRGVICFPEYAQQATAIYFVMTKLVLALYEDRALPGLIDLHQLL